MSSSGYPELKEDSLDSSMHPYPQDNYDLPPSAYVENPDPGGNGSRKRGRGRSTKESESDRHLGKRAKPNPASSNSFPPARAAPPHHQQMQYPPNQQYGMRHHSSYTDSSHSGSYLPSGYPHQNPPRPSVHSSQPHSYPYPSSQGSVQSQRHDYAPYASAPAPPSEHYLYTHHPSTHPALGEEVLLEENEWSNLKCQVCQSGDNDSELLLCDYCNLAYHIYCLRPPLQAVPDGSWFCDVCTDDLLGSNTDGQPHALTRVWGSLPNLLPMPTVQMAASLYEYLPSETLSVVDWSQFKLNLIPPPVPQGDSNGPIVPHTPRMFLLAPTTRFPMFNPVARLVMRFLAQRPPPQGPPPSPMTSARSHASFPVPPLPPMAGRGRGTWPGKKPRKGPGVQGGPGHSSSRAPSPPPSSGPGPLTPSSGQAPPPASPFDDEQRRRRGPLPGSQGPSPAHSPIAAPYPPFGGIGMDEGSLGGLPGEDDARSLNRSVQVTPIPTLDVSDSSLLDPQQFHY